MNDWLSSVEAGVQKCCVTQKWRFNLILSTVGHHGTQSARWHLQNTPGKQQWVRPCRVSTVLTDCPTWSWKPQRCWWSNVLFAAGFGGSGSQVDSARMNLASSFVNGFVNAAFGQDKLLTDDGNKWLYKNKDHGEWKRAQIHERWKDSTVSVLVMVSLPRYWHSHIHVGLMFLSWLIGHYVVARWLKMIQTSTGMLSAAASLGMILLWDVDGGLTQIDKYLYSSEDYIKVDIKSWNNHKETLRAHRWNMSFTATWSHQAHWLDTCVISLVCSLAPCWPVGLSTRV